MPKLKIVIIALAAFLGITVFAYVQTYRAQKLAEEERDSAKKDNEALSKKIDQSLQENKGLQNKISAVSKDLAATNQEKIDIQKRYETVAKEKEALLARLSELKNLKEKTAAAAAQEQAGERVAPVQSGLEDAYWAGILRVKTDLEVQLGSIRGELKNIQINNEQLMREKSNLELDVKNLSRQTQELRQKAEYDQKVSDSLAQELVREKNSKSQIESSAKLVKSENVVLRRQLRSLSDRKVDLERKVADLQMKSKGLEESYAKMETILKDKLFQVDDMKKQLGMGERGFSISEDAGLKESVELPPIVVRSSQGSPSEALEQQGEVLLVNKENNFVVVNLGDNVGLKVGDSLRVYRDDKAIATIEVIQLRKNFSACDIKSEQAPIKIGDKIK